MCNRYLLVTCCLFICCFSQTFVGPKWQTQSASLKFSQLNAVITNNTTPGTYPTLGLSELFLESMQTTFQTVADDMPQQFGGLQRRPKLIHSVGAIGVASWIAQPDNNYTGVFLGCRNVIIRFSCATAPTSGAKGYVPAVSLKCIRSGVASANIFGMYSLEGQDSWNFFKHDLTNHVPDLSNDAPYILKQLKSVFTAASTWPTMLGLADFATYDEMGTQHIPKFPFRLIFHPYTNVRNMFSDSPSSDPFENVIANTLKPGPLYYVYAQDKPTDTQDQLTFIGIINLTSISTPSNFGDKYLFFEHSQMEKDMEIHPEWVNPAKQILQQQQNTPNFVFPDLPFN